MKIFLTSMLVALGVNAAVVGGAYYTIQKAKPEAIAQGAEVLRDRIKTVEIPAPGTAGLQSSNGFTPAQAGANFTVFADKPKTLPALVVDGKTGNVSFPAGVIAGQLYDAAGRQIIDVSGKWVGDPAGLKGDPGSKGDSGSKGDPGSKGDSCAMVPGTTKIRCGTDAEVDIQGPMGIADLEFIERPMSVTAGGNEPYYFNRVLCPAGKKPISGGCGFEPPATLDTNLSVQLVSNSVRGNGWTCVYDIRHFASQTPTVDTFASVLCGTVTVKQAP